MGNLLGLLKKPHESDNNINVVVDFESAEPTNEELEVYNLVIKSLATADDILSIIKTYPGAESYIKRSMQNPNDDNAQHETWKLLTPLVSLLKKAYDLSKQIEIFLPPLLHALCDGENSIVNFEKKQALAKLFSRILDFTLEFDVIKMNKPSIQNDFSFYRRSISKPRDHNLKSLVINKVEGEIVNNILLFMASPYPFMSKISEHTIEHFCGDSSPSLVGVTNSFATLARLCKYMAETRSVYSKFKNHDTKIFCLRVMVSLIVLYDNVHPQGVFHKSSAIDIKIYMKFLKEQDETCVYDLINTIKFTSKHFNDADTPSSIKQLFE